MAEGTEPARLRAFLEFHGCTVVWVRSREAAVNVLDSSQVDALITQMRGARIRGLSLVALARKRNPELGAILIIAPGEKEAATEAMRRGVVDFQVPPINFEKVRAPLERLFERQGLREKVSRMSRRLDAKFGFPGVIGSSGAMMRVQARCTEIAPLDASVLLAGEPGTGKDLIAGVIHRNSPRRNGPFVKVHCPALSPRLLVRELFGAPAQRGRVRRPGRLEIASDGTLYLDDAGALPRDVQGRIAELLRTGQIRPELDRSPVELSVRVVASTSGDLEGLVDRGKFDEGFYDLLAEARIELPPLRHRRRDVPLLARHFLDGFRGEQEPPLSFARETVNRLARFSWPGNVRELRNVVQELVRGLSSGSVIRAQDLPEEIRDARGEQEGLRVVPGTSLAEAERQIVQQTLISCGGNREKAAQILGIGVRTLYRKIRGYR
jgi:DNA-binding NtrC family response regulator